MHNIEIERQLHRAFVIIDNCIVNPCTGRKMNEPTKKKLFLLFELYTEIQSKQCYSFVADKRYRGHLIHVKKGEIRRSWSNIMGLTFKFLGVTTVRTIENLTRILEALGLLSIDHDPLPCRNKVGQNFLKVIRLKTFSDNELDEASKAVEQLIETINESEEIIEDQPEIAECTENSTQSKNLFPIVSHTEIYNTNTGCTIGKRLIAPAVTDGWGVEAAIGGVSKPRVLVPRDEIPEECDTEYYASWIGEKAGQYYTPWVIWDIDDDDPESALMRTREFVSDLLQRVSVNAVRVVFSTRRGFHVYLDSRVLAMVPDENLHEKIKRFACKLLPSTDVSLYTKRHIIGIPNSIHRVTGLYYAPLTIDELFELNISQMRRHAERPHEFDPRSEDMLVCEELAEMYHSVGVKSIPSSKAVISRVLSGDPSFGGVKKGNRDRAMFDLAVRYRRIGLTIHEAYILVLDANTRNDPPMPRETIRKKVNSVYQRDGVQIL